MQLQLLFLLFLIPNSQTQPCHAIALSERCATAKPDLVTFQLPMSYSLLFVEHDLERYPSRLVSKRASFCVEAGTGHLDL